MMKKTTTVICLLFVLCFSYVKAQTSQGSMMLGGGISFGSESYQSNDDYEDSHFYFYPSFGYFVVDNFAVGLDLSIGSNTNDNGVSKTKSNYFAFGPFARYYKYTSNDKFAFFGEVSLLLESGKHDPTPGGEYKSSATEFAISPGFSYFFNEHWALDLELAGFMVRSEDPNKDNDDDKSTEVIFNVQSLNPTLGIRYHF